ncbi:MAG TPA: enolase C-terminal domain-like protein [Bryobacteraceae bacterium]|nr:enolase C-terminal domain-like protein [Bryobacteraceae bacterium]
MKITNIECISLRVPIRPEVAIRAKGGTHSVSPFLLVRINTDEGVYGLGEVSCTPRWSGEDQVTAAHFIRTILEPTLAGHDPREVERLSVRMNTALAGNPFTKAALEMACWDILGKAAGLPVYRVLGGPVRESIPTKWSISGVEPSRAAEIACWALEQGFTTMKVKVGIDAEQDVARVRAVRETIGPHIRLGIDANGAWTPAVAVAMIRRLAEFGVYFAEQPVPPGDVAWLADVRGQSPVPILADESVYSPQDALSLVGARAADAFSVYVGKAAGIGPARRIAAIAESAMLGCTIGSNLELGVGTAAMIHLAMATPGITADQYPCDIIGPLYYTDEILTEPLRLAGGKALLIDRPGLGVELDEAKVKRYRVD